MSRAENQSLTPRTLCLLLLRCLCAPAAKPLSVLCCGDARADFLTDRVVFLGRAQGLPAERVVFSRLAESPPSSTPHVIHSPPPPPPESTSLLRLLCLSSLGHQAGRELCPSVWAPSWAFCPVPRLWQSCDLYKLILSWK